MHSPGWAVSPGGGPASSGLSYPLLETDVAPEEAVVPELGEPALVPAALPDPTPPLVDEPDDPATEPDVGAAAPELGVPFAPLADEPDAEFDAGPPLVEPAPDEWDPDDAVLE